MVVGDGLGDLGMMMQADVAVVLTPGNTFREVCDRYHITIRPLWEYLYGESYEHTVFESESWSEVVAVLGYSLSQDSPHKPDPTLLLPLRQYTPDEK